MIYLDYAANTPVDEKVLNKYVETTKSFFANPNSKHTIGRLAKEEIEKCSINLANYFKTSKEGIIYTSGSSEANNLVIKGIAFKNKDKGKHIIISSLEHSSIVAPCNYLTTLGYEISVISLDKNGLVNLDELKQELRDDTILVSICSVDSELGTIQPISEIGNIIKEYPNCVFHTDATGAIGKVYIDYSNVDFITFSPHKFYGLNGSGCLVNRNNIKLIPLIHGGKSTTIYRSGTPDISNIVSLYEAFNIATTNEKEREDYIKRLNNLLRKELSSMKEVHINSPEKSIGNILNISLIGINNKDVVEKLQEKEIYVSTTTACSLEDTPSKSVLAITNDLSLASNTIRISISHLTTIEEINIFLNEFKSIIKDLHEKREY